jgi:hypothetical protein
MQSGCNQMRVAVVEAPLDGELAMGKVEAPRVPASRGFGVAGRAQTARSYPEIGEFGRWLTNWHSQLAALQYRYASPRHPARAGGLANHVEQGRNR